MKPAHWLSMLLAVGLLLTAADIAMFVALFDTPPDWLAAVVASLSFWGPAALVAWALTTRHLRIKRRILDHGAPARATLRSIGQTASAIGGRAVLRLELTVLASPSFDTTIREAPPYHLAGILRPGVSLPVRIDPRDEHRVRVDWLAVERETTPAS